MEIVQPGKKLKSISQERLNFRRRPILCACTEIANKRATSVAHFTNFPFEVFYTILTQDASLLFLYNSAKKSKMTKKLRSTGAGGGGGVLQPKMTKKTSRGPALRWLRRNAQRIVQSGKNGEGLPIQVYGDRDLFMQKLKSKPACLHRTGAREKSGILNINTLILLTIPKEQVELNKLTEKKVGVTGHFEIFFSKKPLCPKAIHTKTRMQFGQHFDGEVPKKLNHVFLRPFEHGFNKKLGRLCSKIKTTEPP